MPRAPRSRKTTRSACHAARTHLRECKNVVIITIHREEKVHPFFFQKEIVCVGITHARIR